MSSSSLHRKLSLLVFLWTIRSYAAVAAFEFSPAFQRRLRCGKSLASRQRRLISGVADATRRISQTYRGLKPIGIYTISGFPESHHRQVVDRSIPTYKTLKNPLESHHRQVVDRSIPTFVFRCRARRLDLNDPPPAGGGILGESSQSL